MVLIDADYAYSDPAPDLTLEEKEKLQESKKSWLPWVLGGLFVMGLLTFGLTHLTRNRNPIAGDTQIATINQKPTEYFGRNVNVTGNIDTIVGSRAFVLDNPGTGFNSQDLLVISREPIAPIGGGPDDFLYKQDDQVSIKGTVRQFDLRQLEEELGVDLVDEAFIGWNGKPVVVAETVEHEL